MGGVLMGPMFVDLLMLMAGGVRSPALRVGVHGSWSSPLLLSWAWDSTSRAPGGLQGQQMPFVLPYVCQTYIALQSHSASSPNSR